ncbi:hypothetical protein [Amycolatopsis taiwanensis]|uniref:hypothetical protein n=1 Tax=Amycolatopsis taiwanensis TaxID=342230 RepID=UPI000480662F|nr:hypothetical protein [Amycolatopsis taiwanensis]
MSLVRAAIVHVEKEHAEVSDDGYSGQNVDRVTYHVIDTTDVVLDAARRGDFARARSCVQRTEGLARLLMLRHWAWLLADFAPRWAHPDGRQPDLPSWLAQPIGQLVGGMQDRHEESVAAVLIELAGWQDNAQIELAMEMVGELLVELPIAVEPCRYVIARERIARAEGLHTGTLARQVCDETPLVVALTRVVAAYWRDTHLPAEQAAAVIRTLASGLPGQPPDHDPQHTAIAVLAHTIAETRSPGESTAWPHPAGPRPASADCEITRDRDASRRSLMLAAQVVDHAVNGQAHQIIPDLNRHADDPSLLALVLATTAHRTATEISRSPRSHW